MIRSIKTITIAILISASFLGLMYWRRHAREPRRVAHRVEILDNSGSTAEDRAAFVDLAERALNEPNVIPGSTLTIIALGDKQTGNEPRLIARYAVPYSRRFFEGKKALVKRKAETLSDLKARLGQLPRTDRSPIFLSLKRATEQLRANGCNSNSDCYIFIRTDLEETAEKSIRAVLDGAGSRKNLPTPISNEGIRIHFCGLAEKNTSKNADTHEDHETNNLRRIDRLPELWRSFFTIPSLVTFEPYCSQRELVQR